MKSGKQNSRAGAGWQGFQPRRKGGIARKLYALPGSLLSGSTLLKTHIFKRLKMSTKRPIAIFSTYSLWSSRNLAQADSRS